MMAKPLFKRSADDRHDKAAFVLVFVIGVVGILTTRIVGDRIAHQEHTLGLFDLLPVLIAVGIVFLYASYIAWTSERSSVSLDRAGDNAYYLGLLFTLVSLGYSLYKVVGVVTGTTTEQSADTASVQAADRVIGLLPDFGLALSSTIAGILCRILLQQLHNDPADIEAQARQELGRAVRELRASLLRAVGDMSTLSRSINAAADEMINNVRRTHDASTDANTQSIDRVTSKFKELEELLTEQVNTVSGFSERVAKETSTAVSRMNQQLSQLDINPVEVQGRLGALAGELEKLRVQVEQVVQEFSAASGLIASSFSPDIAARLQSAATRTLEKQATVLSELKNLETGVSKTSQQVSTLGDDVSRTGNELVKARKSSQEKLDSAATASSDYVDSLIEAARKLRRTIDDKT